MLAGADGDAGQLCSLLPGLGSARRGKACVCSVPGVGQGRVSSGR